MGSKSHQKLTNWIVKSHKKEKRIKLVTTEKDPERDKAEREEVMDTSMHSRLISDKFLGREQAYKCKREITIDATEAKEEIR